MVSRPSSDDIPGGRSFRASLLEAARELGLPLSAPEAEALEIHYRLLRTWGGKINLTGLKDEEAILRRHFLEPIAAAGLLEDRGRLVDLGSGNGFPAVPLRVLRPNLELVLIEASERKSAFLWTVLRDLGLKGGRVETRRVTRRADLADLLPCRYLTLRAVKGRDFLRGEGGSILEPGGRALFFVSPEESRALRDDPIPGLFWAFERPLPSGPRSVVAILEPEG
jgi:16S rRNA (guanine527-N7)-methyltransferase